MTKEDKKNTPNTFLGDLSSLNVTSTNRLVPNALENMINIQENNSIFTAYEKTQNILKTSNNITTLFSNPILKQANRLSNIETSNLVSTAFTNSLKLWNINDKTHIHHLNKNGIFPVLDNHLIFNTPAESALVKSIKFASYTEKSVSMITPQNLGSKLYLNNDTRRQLKSAFNNFSESYTSFDKLYNNDPLSFINTNPTLSKIATVQFFSTANLIETISVEEKITVEEEVLKNEIKYENEISLSEYLPKIDPGLYNMWKGAVESLHSDNPDKIRHFITSIRELFTHVIHNLAPDSEIKKWTSDPAYYHENRPTRKSRLKFICRNIDDGSFADFLEKDISTTIAFINVFQSGTHKISSDFTEHQLFAIKSKAESTLKYLFEINLNN